MLRELKEYFSEIYDPTPLQYNSNQKPLDTKIQKILNSYSSYFDLVNLWANGVAYMYDEAFKKKAIDFLASTQHVLLKKKKDQEEVNHAYAKQAAQLAAQKTTR